MTQWITMQYVGLDVHKDSVVIAVAEEGRKPGRVNSSNHIRVRCADQTPRQGPLTIAGGRTE